MMFTQLMVSRVTRQLNQIRHIGLSIYRYPKRGKVRLDTKDVKKSLHFKEFRIEVLDLNMRTQA